jgi:hypothetical protein
MPTKDPDRYGTPVFIETRFFPGDKATHARAVLARGTGRNYRVYRLWSGELGVTTADLHGLGATECAAILCDHLLRRLTEFQAFPDGHADHPAVGPGAPEGATGGAFPNEPLPGL